MVSQTTQNVLRTDCGRFSRPIRLGRGILDLTYYGLRSGSVSPPRHGIVVDDVAHIHLIHSNAKDTQQRIAHLERDGYCVSGGVPRPESLREIRESPPAAVLIDLTRSPSTGRDIAVWIRTTKATRHIPIVFVEGDPEKVERIRKLLPDATYTTWSRIRGSLKRALANPPRDPVVPASNLAGYSGTPLPKKLGIKPGSVVALGGAPAEFEQTLGALPDGVRIRRGLRGAFDLLLWFPKSRADLQRRVEQMRDRIGRDGLWIIWPKKASGVTTDLTQTVVRQTGLATGLVDYKVAAIDATYTGLKFALRKGTPPAG